MESITAICEVCDGGYRIKSPLLGVYSETPKEGSAINCKNQCGYILVLGQKYRLEIPKNIQGIVKNIIPKNAINVGYMQELFMLQTLETAENQNKEAEQDEKIFQDKNSIVAPTDGMFYRRPSPDEPNYVEIGSSVKNGQVLGLVEVMKTFNQILYSGENLPETATIREICMEDGAEVKNQQVLFIVDALK